MEIPGKSVLDMLKKLTHAEKKGHFYVFFTGLVCLIIFTIAFLVAKTISSDTSDQETILPKPRNIRHYTILTPTSVPVPTACPTMSPTGTVTFPTDGNVHLLHQQLNITGHDEHCPDTPQSFYSAGEVKTGRYAGYKRIIAVRVSVSLDAQMYITNDFHTYLPVNTPSPWSDTSEPFATTAEVIDQEFPPDIPLPQHFALHRAGLFLQTRNGAKITTPDTALLPNYAHFTQLPALGSGFTLYAEPIQNRIYPAAQDSSYFTDLTSVIVTNSTGLAYHYSLTTPTAINTYNTGLQQAALKRAADKTYAPSTDTAVIPPALRFASSDVTTTTSLYPRYNLALFHVSCGLSNGDTIIAQTVHDADVHAIGTWQGIPVYALNDPNHPLYTLLYSSIAGNGTTDIKPLPAAARSLYPVLPTYADYVSKLPLLFLKDPWNRWIVLAEDTFDQLYDKGTLRGGCGKPVMYFYPTKPTEVKVTFLSPMRLDVQIPKYRNGWDVRAQPNGTLTDLRQQPGDCSRLDAKAFGSEYALQACNNNRYPYIYWAGQTLRTSYPAPQVGAIVTRERVADYLNTTLDAIGFTPNEKHDMLSYWVPEMLQKQAPYYRVSFLQTEAVNQLFPISVTPKPDSMYRLFLDWEPLQTNSSALLPQHLEKITRKGFFMLEWGGVHR